MKVKFGNMALLIFSSVFSLMLLEVAYRSYLFYQSPEKFRQGAMSGDSAISFSDKSPWRFNLEYGFDYKPESIIVGSVKNGQVMGCRERPSILPTAKMSDKIGNDSDDINVLIVSDSMAVAAPNGFTWPDKFQSKLAALTGKSVRVTNMARDGQGVLQMLDIAASQVMQQRQDIIIVAYITDDLTRERIWRREELIDGRLRVFTTASATQDFDLSRSLDTVIILPNHHITMEWCNRVPPPNRDSDPIVREIEARYLIAIAHADVRANLFSPQTSYAINMIRYGNPFQFNVGQVVGIQPRHSLAELTQDERAVKNLKILRNSGALLVPYHLATRTEMKLDREFWFSFNAAQETMLIHSLEVELGRPSILTRENIDLAVDFDRVALSLGDDHPSAFGVDFYADVAIRGMTQDGLLDNFLSTPSVRSHSTELKLIGRLEAGSLLIDNKSYPIVQRMVGSLESASEAYGGIEIHGWAADISNNSPAAAIVVLVNGRMVAKVSPTIIRPDIQSGLGISGPTGFDVVAPLIPSSAKRALISLFILTKDEKAVPIASALAPLSWVQFEPVSVPAN